MKLIKAQIKNFRLLKDLRLDFSTSDAEPLTVIRAANETGKTTCEYALMWALYGSKAVLPNKGDYVLFPADLKSGGVERVDISVEVEFEVDQVFSTGRGAQSVERRVYRLVRSCIERLSKAGGTTRDAEILTMYRLGSVGSEPVSEMEAKRIIENALPEALKDVYFTDGDRAMSFIEAAAAQGVKRKRVSNAVEALLGLEDLQKTERHLDNVARKFALEIDNNDYAKELERLNDQISGFDEDIAEWESEVARIEEQLANGNKELRTCKAQIEEVLRLGDSVKLSSRLKSIESMLSRLNSNAGDELTALSRILSDEVLSRSMIRKPALAALATLEALNKSNKLPKANIPILEELLARDSCFCGADLSDNSDEGRARRREIENAIESSRESDAIQEVATSLFFQSRSINFNSGSATWQKQYEEFSRAYQFTTKSIRDQEQQYGEVKAAIDLIDDSKLIELRDQERQLEAKIRTLNDRNSQRVIQIKEYSQRRSDAELERDRIEKKCNKSSSSGNRLSLARRSQKIFESIIEKLKQQELRRVSEEMNRIFLEMIGADPEANSLTLITRAELTPEFDIRVFGPKGHELNPDQDLNGASRRAITLAFILALTKVSEVEAPNVIDTPLGMMSGYVKQSVLKQLLKEGTQVVLFLTHDEIKGVEELLDKYAGSVYTLTNPAHYPRMLKNNPNIEDARVVRCECNHRKSCALCERNDAGV